MLEVLGRAMVGGGVFHAGDGGGDGDSGGYDLDYLLGGVGGVVGEVGGLEEGEEGLYWLGNGDEGGGGFC